jgi:hypothetical protein
MANILQQIGTVVKSKLDDKVDKTDATGDFIKAVLGIDTDTTTPTVDTEANIGARTGDAAGTIFFGSDSADFYVYDGSTWHQFNNS